MKERILALRRALKMSQGDFAERLGMKSTALSMVEKGVNALTDKNIRMICLVFNVNEPWLRTGTGDMFVDSPYEREFFEVYRYLLPETQESLLVFAKNLLEIQKKYQSSGGFPQDLPAKGLSTGA
jgi:transcriptional regulator with XRE-family HTH domain